MLYQIRTKDCGRGSILERSNEIRGFRATSSLGLLEALESSLWILEASGRCWRRVWKLLEAPGTSSGRILEVYGLLESSGDSWAFRGLPEASWSLLGAFGGFLAGVGRV